MMHKGLMKEATCRGRVGRIKTCKLAPFPDNSQFIGDVTLFSAVEVHEELKITKFTEEVPTYRFKGIYGLSRVFAHLTAQFQISFLGPQQPAHIFFKRRSDDKLEYH